MRISAPDRPWVVTTFARSLGTDVSTPTPRACDIRQQVSDQVSLFPNLHPLSCAASVRRRRRRAGRAHAPSNRPRSALGRPRHRFEVEFSITVLQSTASRLVPVWPVVRLLHDVVADPFAPPLHMLVMLGAGPIVEIWFLQISGPPCFAPERVERGWRLRNAEASKPDNAAIELGGTVRKVRTNGPGLKNRAFHPTSTCGFLNGTGSRNCGRRIVTVSIVANGVDRIDVRRASPWCIWIGNRRMRKLPARRLPSWHCHARSSADHCRCRCVCRGGDVRRHDHAERRLQRQSSGKAAPRPWPCGRRHSRRPPQILGRRAQRRHRLSGSSAASARPRSGKQQLRHKTPRDPLMRPLVMIDS